MLTILSIMYLRYTTCFSVQQIQSHRAHCDYAIRLTPFSYYAVIIAPNSCNQFSFIKEKECLCCEVVNENAYDVFN